jgi:hypothetical protein
MSLDGQSSRRPPLSPCACRPQPGTRAARLTRRTAQHPIASESLVTRVDMLAPAGGGSSSPTERATPAGSLLDRLRLRRHPTPTSYLGTLRSWQTNIGVGDLLLVLIGMQSVITRRSRARGEHQL